MFSFGNGAIYYWGLNPGPYIYLILDDISYALIAYAYYLSYYNLSHLSPSYRN